ncbi:MAG: hypothetical protein AABN33_12675 [Acidobacteriota bacterium]
MLAPGTILRDSYSIVRLIAQGGMGTVYLARHLGSAFAVKETSFDDPSLLKAFKREAQWVHTVVAHRKIRPDHQCVGVCLKLDLSKGALLTSDHSVGHG